eukprot:285796-Amphidinium_carterae.2
MPSSFFKSELPASHLVNHMHHKSERASKALRFKGGKPASWLLWMKSKTQLHAMNSQSPKFRDAGHHAATSMR